IKEARAGVRGQVVLKIFGEDLMAMRATLESVKAVLADVEGVVDLDLYRDRSVPQLQITLDRERLAREGIAIEDAQEVIETALAGKVITHYYRGDRPILVRVRLPHCERDHMDRVGTLAVP